MPRKRIGVALWEHFDAEGLRHLVWFGDEVDLTDEEAARGERAGVFATEEPELVGDATPEEYSSPGLAPIDPSLPILPFVDDATSVAVGDGESGDVQDATLAPAAADDDGQADEVLMPKLSGTKEAWVRYAMARGMTEAEATELTRDELKARFLAASS